MNPENLEQEIKKLMMSFIESEKDAIGREFSQESFQDLQAAFSSADAIAFTAKMNQFYKDQGITDDNGDPLTIQHPENLHAKVTWNSDGTSGTIKFTESEEQWIRANQVYGNNILGKLGFNYFGGI